MGLGVSLILIAVGAVMAWAVHVSTTGFNVNTIGYILLVVGIVGALLSLVFWSDSGRPRLPDARDRPSAHRDRGVTRSPRRGSCGRLGGRPTSVCWLSSIWR